MSKKLRNTDAVFHAWAHQQFESAECGNVSYDGPRLYSYAACIAALLPNNVVAHTTRSWSMTTSGHQSAARSATNHMHTVRCYNPEWTANQNRGKTKDTVESILRGIPEPVLRKDGKETVLSEKKRREAHASALRLVEQFNEYLAATGETDVPPLQITADMEAAVEELRRQDAEAKKLKEEQEREAAARVKKHVEAWKKHEHVSNLVNLRAAPPALRLSPDREVIETSWGAAIPTRDADKMWRWVNIAMKMKREVVPDDDLPREEKHVGHYRITRFNPDGSIVVGCHTIAYSEIEGIAKALGFLEKANG